VGEGDISDLEDGGVDLWGGFGGKQAEVVGSAEEDEIVVGCGRRCVGIWILRLHLWAILAIGKSKGEDLGNDMGNGKGGWRWRRGWERWMKGKGREGEINTVLLHPIPESISYRIAAHPVGVYFYLPVSTDAWLLEGLE
jgi:hypothetical protein